VAAGAVCGTAVALLTPVRYVSDALVSFDNANGYRAAALINEAVNAGWTEIAASRGLDGSGRRRDLTWQQVESGGTKTDAFRIQFVGGNPGVARSVVQDVLAAIDHRVTNLHGGDDNPFEEIRGVDGALLPMNDAPVPVPATEPASQTAIPFDDEHAKASPLTEFRAVKMNLIDPPSLPDSEGVGWWAVAIGVLSGLALALVISLIGGTGGWFHARNPAVIPDIPMS
jgi:hypothetical protein